MVRCFVPNRGILVPKSTKFSDVFAREIWFFARTEMLALVGFQRTGRPE